MLHEPTPTKFGNIVVSFCSAFENLQYVAAKKCCFKNRPAGMFSKGKRTHNRGIDEKGLGRTCHTLSRSNLFSYYSLLVSRPKPYGEKETASSLKNSRSSFHFALAPGTRGFFLARFLFPVKDMSSCIVTREK